MKWREFKGGEKGGKCSFKKTTSAPVSFDRKLCLWSEPPHSSGHRMEGVAPSCVVDGEMWYPPFQIVNFHSTSWKLDVIDEGVCPGTETRTAWWICLSSRACLQAGRQTGSRACIMLHPGWRRVSLMKSTGKSAVLRWRFTPARLPGECSLYLADSVKGHFQTERPTCPQISQAGTHSSWDSGFLMISHSHANMTSCFWRLRSGFRMNLEYSFCKNCSIYVIYVPQKSVNVLDVLFATIRSNASSLQYAARVESATGGTESIINNLIKGIKTNIIFLRVRLDAEIRQQRRNKSIQELLTVSVRMQTMCSLQT